jgi:hypothetical protein
MREIIARFPTYDQSPAGLEALIRELKKPENGGLQSASRILGISRSTISYWEKKLSFYRQFAGQTPEAILDMLAGIAEREGIDAAAKLIQVNPKTLQLSFNQRQPKN